MSFFCNPRASSRTDLLKYLADQQRQRAVAPLDGDPACEGHNQKETQALPRMKPRVPTFADLTFALTLSLSCWPLVRAPLTEPLCIFEVHQSLRSQPHPVSSCKTLQTSTSKIPFLMRK
jgi:hypothetical protein